MICRNCQANVDDDLIFCTNCGARLYENADQLPTNAMSDSVAAQSSRTNAKKSSNLKWVALIVALLAVPAALLGAYLLMRKPNQPTIVQNTAKPAPTRKANTNIANSAANNSAVNGNFNQNANSNFNPSNANANANTNAVNAASQTTAIFDEQIEIAPGEHLAYPFKLASNAKFTGELQIISGDEIKGFVYFQEQYDEHFPDETYKVFGFAGANPKPEQTLVPQDYVLVFLNPNQSATTIKGKFSVAPQTSK